MMKCRGQGFFWHSLPWAVIHGPVAPHVSEVLSHAGAAEFGDASGKALLRKGYWQPDAEVLQRLAELHIELVAKHGAACSYETCGNAAFREFMQQQLSAPGYEANPQTLNAYQLAVSSALNPNQAPPEVQGIELNEVNDQLAEQTTSNPDERSGPLILATFLLIGIVLVIGNLTRPRPGSVALGSPTSP